MDPPGLTKSPGPCLYRSLQLLANEIPATRYGSLHA